MSKKYTRRDFTRLLSSGCASIGATTLLSSVTNLGLINAAAAANSSASFFNPTANDYKALVCIMLGGGNDSFNMLVPRGTDEYAEYAETRASTALAQADLLAINPTNISGKEYGLHPGMPRVQNLFETGKLSFISNVGTLGEPTTMAQFESGSVALPDGLFSHSDQEKHWNTSLPDNRSAITGWAGRMADILASTNSNQNISMNIQIGNGLFGKGASILPYGISNSGNGATLLDGSTSSSFYETLKRATFDNIVDETYSTTLRQAYANTVNSGIGNGFEFSSALSGAPNIATSFDGAGGIGNNLNQIARTIAVRDTLGFQKQTFFSRTIGWDTHSGGMEAHAQKIVELDNALGAFYEALEELGVADNVVTFVVSDFGRTLTSNGRGTDHGWGGNVMVMGGPVDGQKIFGTYPDLYAESSRDVGRGRMIPTTSTDEYYAELALWFGASTGDINQILPNINRFWTPTSGSMPIGFIS